MFYKSNTFNFKNDDTAFCRNGTSPQLPLQVGQLDPEELKDALLQQAIAQRRALVTSSLRPGTGRVVKRAQYKIVIKPQVQPVALMFDDHCVEPKTGNNSNKKAGEISAGPYQYPSPIEGVPERLGGALAPGIQNAAQQARSPSMPAVHRGSITPVGGLAEMSQQYAPVARVAEKHASPVDGLVRKEGRYPSSADFGMQTGPSIDGSAEKRVWGVSGDAAGDAADYDDDNYGAMDGGDWGGWGDYDDGGDGDAVFQQHVDDIPPIKKPRRPILNPGIRLRNQLPRKSLAIDPSVGRQEIAPGIRRSTRQPREPLRWWLGEKKEFDRVAHKTLPTVRHFTTTDPNTPWKTVADPKDWKNQREQLKLRYQRNSKQLATEASKSARSKGKATKAKDQQGKRSADRARSETRGKGRGRGREKGQKGKKKTGPQGRPAGRKGAAADESEPALDAEQEGLENSASFDEEIVKTVDGDEVDGKADEDEIVIANENITTRRAGRSFFVPEDDGTPEERSMNDESLNEWGSEEETEPLGTRPDSIPPNSDARAPSEITLRRRDSVGLSPSIIFNMISPGARGKPPAEETGDEVVQGNEEGLNCPLSEQETEPVPDVLPQPEEQ